MDTLAQIYSRHSADRHAGMGDKGTLHSYIPVYEELLAPYRQTTGTVLEIGVAAGHSLRMWREYFLAAKIVGVDIRECAGDTGGCSVIVGDATQPETYQGMEDPVVVIDDGSHRVDHQAAAFRILWPRLQSRGMYVIEDIVQLGTLCSTIKCQPDLITIYDFRDVSRVRDDVLLVIRKPDTKLVADGV